MRRQHLSVFLILLPWAVCFLVAFLAGWLEDGTNATSMFGLLISGLVTLVGPFVVSLYLMAKLAKGVLHRILALFLLMAAAYACTMVLPAPARVSVWGEAYRLRRELPMKLVQSTAVDIKQKRDKGIFRTTDPKGQHPMESDTFVDESELPAELRPRFEYVKFNPQFLCSSLNRRVGILYPLVPLADFQTKQVYRISGDLYLSMR